MESAEKGGRLNASFSSTRRGHGLVMCCEWLAERHAERANSYRSSQAEDQREGGLWVCVGACFPVYVNIYV